MLVDASEGTFDDVYAIYVASLPARERKGRDALAAMVTHPAYAFIVAHELSVVVGFAILFTARRHGFSLLEYMAVDERRRGSGIGDALLRHAYREAVARNRMGPMLVEVESDREPGSERELRSRRKQFYRRAGCREVEGLSFIMPLPGSGPPPAMDLMVSATFDSIPAEQLRDWLTVIYASVYGCDANDERIEKMLAHGPSVYRLV